MTQKEFLSSLSDDAIIVGSLGTISKDLEGRKNAVLVKGAMGCAVGVGLGIALNTKKKVIVAIGEGALLMKLGSLATVARYRPKNLEIIIINNGVYASTGGQKNNGDWLSADDWGFVSCWTPQGN
jgi:thiamine pyrophosphate-dependent acetolactate synthase large subunit-like protein